MYNGQGGDNVKWTGRGQKRLDETYSAKWSATVMPINTSIVRYAVLHSGALHTPEAATAMLLLSYDACIVV
jgi:hypothetical protein